VDTESKSEIDRFAYEHPLDAIAQEPLAVRDGGRLLHVIRHADEPPEDRRTRELPDLLRAGDLLVLNEACVMPARLVGFRSTGGRVSVLVVEARGRQATVLLGARGTCLPGEDLQVAGEPWRIVAALGGGRFEVEARGARVVKDVMAELGRMPLPPYIHREPISDPRDATDRERYQTVFASGTEATAVAAPTAGLHFTPAMLEALEARGVRMARLRLDVGEGTFRPVRAQRLDDHEMHRETYDVPEATAAAFAETRAAGGRVVAVGTTVVRTLESAVSGDGRELDAGPGSTRLFIRPGHVFRSVDVLFTNFHQPRSTLLVLVTAFGGYEPVMRAYRHAVEAGYRLFSYGDAMLLEPRAPGQTGPDLHG
jgi:S-adenosylmethionine:tRNA ribosyltransferase-isomerase